MTSTGIERLGRYRWVMITAAGGFLAALALGFVLIVGPAKAVDDPPCEIDCGGDPPVNAPPTVGVNSDPVAISEGGTAVNTGTYSDLDGNTTVTLSASVGTVSKDFSGDGTWRWSFPTNDGPAQNQTVTITATDSDNASASTTFTLNVNNVAPTAAGALNGVPPSIPEGSPFLLFLSGPFFDPSSVDMNLGFQFRFDCGDGLNYNAFSPSNGRGCTTNDNGNRTIRGQIRDKDQTPVSEYSRPLTINNVAPTGDLDGPNSVDEGVQAVFSFINQSDPSSADINARLRYAFNCNGGSLAAATYANSSTDPSVRCIYDDGPASPTVRARIIDKDNGFTERTKAITVNNVGPQTTLAANNPLNVNENSAGSHTYLFSITDVSGDTLQSVDAGCGTNGTELDQTNNSVTCRFGDGTKTSVISVTATDSDGTAGNTATQTVNIANVAPTATFNKPNGPINEASNFDLSLTSPSDPGGADTSAGFQYAFDCNGDGAYSDFSNQSNTNCSPASDDGPGTLDFGAKIRDRDGGVTEYTGNVSVANVAPEATFNAPTSVEEGRTINLSLTNPSDPSSVDTSAGFEYAFDCDGDGNYAAFSAQSSASCTAPSAPASLTVKGQIKDEDGGVNEYTKTVTITDDVTRPTVLENSENPLIPLRNATLVSRTTDVRATFSEPMAAVSLEKPDHTSTTFKLQMFNKKTKKWKTIPATITLSNGNQTATLDPFGATEGSSDTPLAANKKFRGFITGGTNGVKDAQGNLLATNFIWTFKTGG
jgi:hypothetical protein